MAFRLKADQNVGKTVKRIVRSQIDKALEELEPQAKSEDVVHDARKRFKKIRAILRLVRDELGEKIYRQENTSFRDAARPLTGVRDAKVLVEALDKLIEHFAAEVPPAVFASIQDVLKERQHALQDQVLHGSDCLKKVTELIDDARSRVRDWTIRRGGWGAICRGLKRSYKRTTQMLDAVGQERTPENLHEWRKQAKYLWHQLQLLERVKPVALTELADQVHELTQLLGDDHDLFVLQQTVTAEPDAFGGERIVHSLVPLLERRRQELEDEALSLGRGLFSEKPKMFIDRLREYWKAWRSNPEAAARV